MLCVGCMCKVTGLRHPPLNPGALSPLRSCEIADSTSERVSGLGRGSTARVTFSGARVPQKGLEPLTSPVTYLTDEGRRTEVSPKTTRRGPETTNPEPLALGLMWPAWSA